MCPWEFPECLEEKKKFWESKKIKNLIKKNIFGKFSSKFRVKKWNSVKNGIERWSIRWFGAIEGGPWADFRGSSWCSSTTYTTKWIQVSFFSLFLPEPSNVPYTNLYACDFSFFFARQILLVWHWNIFFCCLPFVPFTTWKFL